MNVLLLDNEGCGTDMAYRASQAGHKVKWWNPENNKPPYGKPSMDGWGFRGIEKVHDWKPHMMWAKSGIIINVFQGKIIKELDRYRDFGFPIFGPSWKSTELEIDRAKGMEELKKHGVQVPEYKTFGSLEEAKKYASKIDDRLVFKTMGDEEDKSLSYVSHSPKDMVWRIQSWIDSGMKLKGPCMLQDFKEGIEVAVAAWMGKDGFLPDKWNINFEFKKLMSGDYGPSTLEMGTVMQYVEKSKLADQTLIPMEETIRKLGHFGDIDLNTIIDKQGNVWCLEFTARFGWPATQIEMQQHKGDPINWMKDCVNGKDTLEVDRRVAMGVVMAAPPFPEPDDKGKAFGLLISGIEEEWGRVSPWQIMRKNGEYLSTGSYICVVNGLAPDVHDVIPQVYEAADKIKFPNRMMRDDVGKKLEKQLPKLHALGFEEMPLW